MMQDNVMLNNGLEMPAIGLGTWRLTGPQGTEAIELAINEGYRLIDTARVYGNETEVGQAIRNSGVAREKLFITTKLWNDDHGYHSARSAFEESLSRLGLQYLDLYLIHWPATEQRHNAWRAMEELLDEGTVKSIGVANYEVYHLEELMERSDTKPAVNQILFHPFVYKRQKPILDFCREQAIVVQAYSPLAEAKKLDDPTISELAKKHKKTNAQIMLRWAIQHGTVPIPKSSHPKRIAENIEVFRFELSDDDMERLNSLSS